MPLIRFLIGGVQKGGTTALASYLAAHPAIALPGDKEAHVFDAPDFDEAWNVTSIDTRFATLFDSTGNAHLHGDATPITLFHPRLIDRVQRYNPAMRWVVLLRDPVERAISHYFMERGRDAEPLPLLPAVLAERWRLRSHADDFGADSPLRKWSYAARGRYAGQIDALRARFPAEQILLLRSADLATDPGAVVTRVLDFLGLPALPSDFSYRRQFEGGYRRPGPWSPGRCWLRWVLRGEVAELRRRHGIDLHASGL